MSVWRVVGPGRFELPTSPLSGVRSNQLSYGPMARIQWKAPHLGSRSRPFPDRKEAVRKEKRRRRHPACLVVYDASITLVRELEKHP